MRSQARQLLFFSIFLCLFWAFGFLLYLSVQGFGEGIALPFCMVFAFGHAAEFAFAAFLIMILFAALPRGLQFPFRILLAWGVTLFLASNYFVYKQFRLHIDLAMLTMFFGEDSSEIFVFPFKMYVQAALGALFLLAVVATGWCAADWAARRKSNAALKVVPVLLFLCILSFHGVYAWAKFTMYAPVVSKISALPLVQPLSMTRTLKSMGFEPSVDLPRFVARDMKYPLVPLAFDGGRQDLNIVVIMVDALRHDMVTQEVTPNIHEFAKKSLRFNNHNANSNHSRHGVFTFFYGLPGKYWEPALAENVSPVLVDTILERDYELGIYGSASLASPEFDRTVFSRVPNLELKTEGKDSAKRDLTITNKFLDFLDSRDKSKPFFTFFYYDSTHSYRYDKEIFSPKFLPDIDKNYLNQEQEHQAQVFNRYRNAAGYVDVLVGRVLEALENKGLLENTVAIITGDHGEEFDDLGLGYLGHNGNFSIHQVNVPLIVYWPGMEPADYDHRTSHMDVAPTLLEKLFGCSTPAEAYSCGYDLFRAKSRPYVFVMGSSGSYGINVEGTVSVFPPIGPSYAVDEATYRPAQERLPKQLYLRILEDLARFKK